MKTVKRLLLAGTLMAVLGTSIGGCVYYVRGPYPLITIHNPGEYRDHRGDRGCRYRDCYR